jgi:hypothetical protein
VNGRSKIDSWSDRQFQRNDIRFVHQPISVQIEAKSRVDTWLSINYKTRKNAIEVNDLLSYFSK